VSGENNCAKEADVLLIEGAIYEYVIIKIVGGFFLHMSERKGNLLYG
jgi:hypothetical protein